MKIKLTVKIYEEVKEIHEVIVDKEAYNEASVDVFDYISEDTLVDKRWGNTTDYEIIKEEEIK